MPLLGMGTASKLQQALDELVQEGKLEYRDREGSSEKEYRYVERGSTETDPEPQPPAGVS